MSLALRPVIVVGESPVFASPNAAESLPLGFDPSQAAAFLSAADEYLAPVSEGAQRMAAQRCGNVEFACLAAARQIAEVFPKTAAAGCRT